MNIQAHKESAEVSNNLLDSRRWASIQEREGDVVIATWAKTGTTWVQQIVANLLFGDAPPSALSQVSPWIENRHFPLQVMRDTLEMQKHRRFMKTHLPATAFTERVRSKYIYIGRDGRDVLWSWYHHHKNLNDTFYQLVRKHPDSVPPYLSSPTADIREYFLNWLRHDGQPLWPFWGHIRSWWSLRAKSNVLLLHFDDLKRDLNGSIARLATFLGIEVDSSEVSRVATRSSLAYMKDHAVKLLPEMSRVMNGGGSTFLNRGEGGAWRSILLDADIAAYEARMLEELEIECVRWLSRPYGAEPSVRN